MFSVKPSSNSPTASQKNIKRLSQNADHQWAIQLQIQDFHLPRPAKGVGHQKIADGSRNREINVKVTQHQDAVIAASLAQHLGPAGVTA